MLPVDGSATASPVFGQSNVIGIGEVSSDSTNEDYLLSEERATGGPDEFGYTWDNTNTFNWIDAKTLGTYIDLFGSDTYYQTPVSFGFSFPFYGNNYSSLYVTTNGLLCLSSPQRIYNSQPIPAIYSPNNIIAPLWEVMGFYRWGNRPNAGIYIYQGGVQPNRYLVVEWFRADIPSYDSTGGDEKWDLTFEVIMYENGDIVMQYLNLDYDPNYFSPDPEVGIENSTGEIGLAFPGTFPNFEGKSIRFSPPPPHSDVSLISEIEGGFVSAGQQVDYPITVQNSGDFSPDTYNLSVISDWPISIMDQEGLVEIVEPISLNKGESMELTIRITVPGDSVSGGSNIGQLIATSTSDASVTESISWTSAVPVPFIHVFGDSVNSNVPQALYISQEGQTTYNLPDNFSLSDLVVAELANRNQIYFGINVECADLGCEYSGEAIYFWILDRLGQTVVAPTLLSDWGSPSNNVTDKNLTVSVSAAGEIGVAWERFQSESELNLFNSNIFYLVLNEDGTIIVPQTNLTQDGNWYEFSGLGAIYQTYPKIAATRDGNFTIGWNRIVFSDSNLGFIRDIFLSVVNNLGGIVLNPIPITASSDAGGATTYFSELALTALNGNQVWVSWIKKVAEENNGVIEVAESTLEYSIWDSDGVLDNPISAIDDFYARLPVATQLSDGKIMLAADARSVIKLLIVDGTTFIPSAPPVNLDLPESSVGDKRLSIIHDDDNRAIIAWHLDSQYNVQNDILGYTLITSAGLIETAPMTYYKSIGSGSNAGYVISNANGYAITNYHPIDYPEFTSVPDEVSFTDILYEYSITVADADLPEDTLTITALTLPDWLDFTDYGDGTALLSGTPSTLEIGDHAVELKVEDSFGMTDTQSFTITVAASTAPAITSADSVIFTEGMEGTYTIVASGGPAPTISVSGGDLPTGVTLLDNGDGTATLSGAPGEGSGGMNYIVTLTASNGIAPDANQTFTLVVGIPPEFDSGDSDSGVATVGEYAEFTESVTGYPDDPEITISGDLPVGMQFSDDGFGTAAIFGTPEAGTGGIYPVTLTADNGTAVVDTLEFTLTVKTIETIGTAGGTISSNGGDISIEIPSGSLSEEITFEFIPLAGPTEGPPRNFAFAGTSFEILARMGEVIVHPTFDPPMVVEIHYDESELDGLAENKLLLNYWDIALLSWVDAADSCLGGAGYTYYPELDYFTVEICHLTEFAVMGETGMDIYLPLIIR